MAILNVLTSTVGLVGVVPKIVYIDTNDTVAAVTADGYLNSAVQEGFTFTESDMALVTTKTSVSATSTQVGWLEVSFSPSTGWSLVSTGGPGSVTLPTIAHHIATYGNTTGGLTEDPSTAISGGNIQAGLTTGTSGKLYSCPGTTTTGRLAIAAVANAAAYDILISNASHGQASTYTITDCGNAAGRLLNAATATPFVSGNFPQNSGTAGLMVDSGLAVNALMANNAVNTMSGSGQIILLKANGTESGNAVTASGNAGVITTSALTTAGAGNYAITWTNTKITTASVIVLTIMGGSNSATFNISVKATAGSGTSTLTIYNNTAATSLNGTLLIGYAVL